MTCWKPASPPEHKHATTALAADWTDVETFSRPPRHGTTECADPEASWGHRNSNLPGPEGRAVLRLLPVRRHHDGRRTRPGRSRAGPQDDPHQLPPRPGPRPRPRACPHARPRHHPRRHPRRLRLRPPRRRRLGHPAPRRRRPAHPGPAPARPRPPGHPRTARSSPTATSTAPPPPGRCWNSGRCPATPPRTDHRARHRRPAS